MQNQKWLGHIKAFFQSNSRKTKKRPVPTQLRIEDLEERAVPAAVFTTGNGVNQFLAEKAANIGGMVADIDQDGGLDLVGDSVHIGQQSGQVWTTYQNGPGVGKLVDIDGDNDLDVVILRYVPARKQIVVATAPKQKGVETFVLQEAPLMTERTASSEDGNYFLYEVSLYEAKSLKELRVLGGRPYPIFDPHFCLNDQLAVWRKLNFLEFVNVASGKVIGKLKDAEPIDRLRVAPDGIHFAVFTNEGKRADSRQFVNGTVKIGDVRTRKWLATYRGHPCRVTSLAFSSDSRYLASGGKDGKILLWDTIKKDGPSLLQDRSAEVLCFSPDSQYIVVAGKSKKSRFYRPTVGEPVRTVSGKARVDYACFSSDGKTLATGELDSRVHVRDAETGKEQFTLPMGQRNVYLIDFSPDGKYLAAVTWGEPRKLQVWDLQTRQSVFRVSSLRMYPMGLAFSPTGKAVALTDQDGTLRVWDIRTHTLVIEKKGKSRVFAVAYSPNGELIATGDNERRVILWDAVTGALVHTFRGHNAGVTGVCFNADGTRLASCSNDGTVKLWDPLYKEEAFSLSVSQPNQRVALTALAFSPDGRFLAAIAPEKGILVWDAGE